MLIVVLLLSRRSFGQSRRIYLKNDDHTDFLWTADEETYERVFQEMIDNYLELANKTNANPAPYQCRFNCDGSRMKTGSLRVLLYASGTYPTRR
jgi:alpha-mannosidase